MCGSSVTALVHRSIQALAGGKPPRRPGPPANQPAPANPPTPAPCVSGDVFDLTHVLTPDFPMWPGDPQFSMTPYSPLTEDSFFANTLVLHEHSGTHIDAPAHASPGGITVEQIPASALIAPLAVVDLTARVRQDPGTLLSVEDILGWEREHGDLPGGALLTLRCGWSARAGDAAAFFNLDEAGAMRTPGFDPEAVRFLAAHRALVGIGTDTMSIDAGRSQDFGAHVAALGSGLYAVEALANLESVPAAGATVVVGAPKHAGGSGGPTRVLAVVPR